MAADHAQLLKDFNPALVLLPQDFSRPRPYRSWFSRSQVPRGDYHPCSAEFFLDQVVKRDRPKSWGSRSDPRQNPIGLARLKQEVLAAGATTVDWELDIGPIRSQKPGKAWPSYRAMVEGLSGAFMPTVYARAVPYPDRIALQYWYIYTYNDAGNYHEGDWEMVTLELGANGNLMSAGYNGHASGFRRTASDVQTRNGHPVVYVARGSHAAYFEHLEGGHRTRSLPSPKGLPPVIETIIKTVHSLATSLIVVLGWNDFTPEHPDSDGNESWNRGVIVEPDLKILPSKDDVSATSPFWWMLIRCRWGSSHSRLRGTKAPKPPWEREPEWSDPLKWLHDLE